MSALSQTPETPAAVPALPAEHPLRTEDPSRSTVASPLLRALRGQRPDRPARPGRRT